MKKKNLLIGAASLALVAALSIGGTLAYLSAKTDTKTNVFTGSNDNLKGRIEETFEEDKASHYIPGEAIVKKPTLVNLSGNSAYVAIELTYKVDDKEVTAKEFADYARIDGFSTDFTEIGTDVYFYNEVLSGKATTPELFTTVTPLTSLSTTTTTTVYTKTEYEEIKNTLGEKVEVVVSEDKDEVVVTEVAGALPKLEVIVSGYMVQAENITEDNAKVELLKLVNAQ